MWKGSEDPGGGPPDGGPSEPPQSSEDLQDMKDQFEQQQMLITQLKEIIKKTDQTATTVTQEKVAEYANTLTKMKSRAKRHSIAKEREGDGEVTKVSRPASEKVLLLRQQMEQNKAKLAERGKSQKGIEEMVAQVKAQLDDSQQQINLSQTPLNISLFEDRVDYTPQLSSQELYNILLNKDKRISEMNAKISKLQANVMDLQENVKEKDSVIDARTKAITLMSENLSKKSKTTLDTLEDTKEQMRRMQENFIDIEEQLKAENVAIKTELGNKSVEVQRLQAENSELTLKNSELQKTEKVLTAQIAELENAKSSPITPTISPTRRSPSKSRKSKKGKFPSKADTSKADEENSTLIADLEQQLTNINKQFSSRGEEINSMKKQHQETLEEHENTIKELQEKQEKLTEELNTKQEVAKVVKVAKVETIRDDVEDNAELNKLKQQVDEANKNMIKVKAQHKSKVKELTKKIDAFKKISDVNAELVKVENENSKLQMKIAELEEEKGQMQLGMVDSRGSTTVDELEVRIKEMSTLLEENDTTIKNHVTDSAKYQEELRALREQMEQITNDEVKQELTTVQFEEQYECLEKEKALLQGTIETLERQILESTGLLEVLKKEKSEIQIKYEGLLQENAELIDRLEKLSAEKVSSAESIEIVENLTQQEKLELEAYQKSLLPKNSMDNLEDNADLNDSVNQLTEETSELLQKIELFTVERREVMEKLELLTEENNYLSLKLKEVENNRDVLVETYEQLQTEKEVLDTKLEEYETQIQELKKIDVVDHAEAEEYKKYVQVQKEEISDLQLKLLSLEKSNQQEQMHEHELEEKYMKLIAENEELLLQFNELRESNQNYEEVIQENKQELIKYAQLLDANCKLNEEQEKLKVDLALFQQNNIEHVQLLEKKNLEIKNLADSVDDYEKELNEKYEVIKTLETQIHALQEEKVAVQNRLAEKLSEVETVRLEKEQKEVENEKLVQQTQSGANEQNTALQVKVEALQVKNKEQLEKMKKIAANLKKKTLDYKELEAKFNELSTRKESLEVQQSSNDSDRKQDEIMSLQAELASTLNELQSLKQDYSTKGDETLSLVEGQRNLQLENNQIVTRNEEITSQLHTYSAQIEDLQNIIREYESQLSLLNREMESIRSTDACQEKVVIQRLNEDIEALKYNSQSSNNALQMKIHEQEICIETLEQELQMYKEKASQLEEGLSEVEARQQSLEQQTIDLGNKLESKESSFIEATEKEEQLEGRLKALAEKDRCVEEKLVEVQEENGLLQGENQKMVGELASYKKQVESYNLRLKEFEDNQAAVNVMEAEKGELELKCRNLENEIKKLNMDLTTLQTETERSENELQQQFEACAFERKQMMEQLEISGDEITALAESRNEVQRTVDDLNGKLDQQQTEFEDTINKYHGLQQEHKKTLSQLEEFDKVNKIQGQILQEYQQKEVETPEYLQQLLNQKVYELQEFKRTYVPSPADFFSENVTEANLNKDIHDLQQKLSQQQTGNNQYSVKIQELEQELQQRVESLQINETLLKQLQKDLMQKDGVVKDFEAAVAEVKTQLDFARNMLEQVEANNFQTLNRNNELEQEVQRLVQQSNEVQQQLNQRTLQPHPRPSQQLHWPEASDDPFAFVHDQPAQEQVMMKAQAVPVQAVNEGGNTGNNHEELLQKIKTLEFMVHNAELEKERAMIQCAQVSEELGRLIYEREQQQMSSQVSQAQSHTSNITTTESQFNLESQIVSGDEISLPPHIPHEQSKNPEQCSSSQNITEEMCAQKRAYECTPSTFADDDGWGFDVEETKLEETHALMSSASASRVSELEERIRLLHIERDAHLEEIHQANVKSGKLIKKLKEFKARNEQLVAKIKAKSSDDFGLEDAIQEELKMQIASLEKKLKETDGELVRERAERENIAKRVDVLTAANERLVEMKEKQDIEVLGYQQQSRELQQKLEKVAWSSDFNEQVVSTSSNTNSSITSISLDNTDSKMQELRETLKELTLDNEELQAMLEEQTRLRKEAEGRAKSVQTDAVDQGQLDTALLEKANLISKITVYESDMESLRAELESMNANFSKTCEERDGVSEDLRKLNEKLQENYKEKTLLEASLLESGILIESLRKTIEEMQAGIENAETLNVNNAEDVSQLKIELDSVKYAKEALESEKGHVHEQFSSLQASLEDLNSEKQHLLEKNALLESELSKLRDELQLNKVELAKLRSETEGSEALIQEVVFLKEELKEIDSLRQQLLDQQAELDAKLLATTEQLAMEWSQHVDQRGNDVAESWKLHVETRENEFVQLEQALRKELYEIEEKCNALVNENNELRRNVDAEIRNEVDRISAMQQQITDRQAHVAQLSEALHQKDAELERLHEENANLTRQLHEYEGRINTGAEDLTALLQSQEEKDKTIAELSGQLQCASDNKAGEEIIEALRRELTAKDNEITQCKSTIDQLTMDMAEMAKVKSQVAENQLQLSEVSKDKERNEKLKQKLEESSFQVTTLQGTLLEKEHRLQELETFLQQQQSDDSSSKMQLQTHVQELQQQIAQYAMQLQENNLHIGSLNEEIESYKVLSNHLQTKDTEIQRLNNLFEERSREHEYALENQLLESQSVLSTQTQEHDALRRLLNQTEIARDELMLSKDSEIEAYREQLESVNKQLGEYQSEYAGVQNQLASVTGQIGTHEQEIATFQQQLVEYARQINELNGIIEGQVFKIEELQADMYEKSRNYDVLVAEMDDTKELQKKVRFAESAPSSDADTPGASPRSREENPEDAVYRAELDLALYMLHQRDVRCEELTVELMQLLEERDTLQLRLSNALREKEAIRSKIDSGETQGSGASSDAAFAGRTKDIILGATGTEMATEAKEGQVEGALANKLSELKVVGYKKDKTLVDEQEVRRMQQMAFLEQHKDEMSRLPAEAQARLLDASYTLSRDVQSPSKVLLNWLWGKSTPKVNNV